MKRMMMFLSVATVALAAGTVGCKSTPVPPVNTGFLTTSQNLVQVSPASWRYRNPSGRMARYDKFIVRPVELAMPEGAPGQATSADDLQAVRDYMHKAFTKALIEGGNQIVDAPAGDVAVIRTAITDAFAKGARVGISVEAEVIDSVSTVQLGAAIESETGPNLTLNNFWREHDAKVIMDAWAARLREFVDSAHSG